MRDNGPITDREILLRDGDLLVSKTDPKGKIIFVNRIFIEISGFSEREPVPEFQRVNALLRAMKAKLGYAALEMAELDRKAEEDRRRDLNRVADGLEGRVRTVVARIGSSFQAVSAASVELTGSTVEIARAADHAARGTASASQSVQVVSGAAEGTGRMAGEVHQAAEVMKAESAKLDAEVRDFLRDIRTA